MHPHFTPGCVDTGAPRVRQLGAGNSPPWGGVQPWFWLLLGINVAPQLGIISNQAAWGNTAERWNGVDLRRTTESDTANQCRYRVSGKNLHVARCTSEPLPVIARSWVFRCFLHLCIATVRLFVAFFEPKWEIIRLRLQGRCTKFCSGNGVGCGWGRAPHWTGWRPTTCFGFGNRLRPCLHTQRRTPRRKRLWFSE